MLPLEIFRERNFAVGNLTTLVVWGGFAAATFFITIFLQQVAGYTAIEAGLTLTPITLVMFTLSRRFGALSARIGPRALMGVGPVVAGIGLLWLGRLDSHVDHVSDMLPGVLLLGAGFSMTVAPLTSTVLGAVPQHHAGVASGANNAIARVAGLLAIAAVGAVVAAQFSGNLDERLANVNLTPAERAEIEKVKHQPLAGSTGPPRIAPAVEAASVGAYRWGVGVTGGLVIVGGLISLLGIANPQRREGEFAEREPGGPSQLLHPCPRSRRAERAEPAVAA
jgi:hypothetical protein